MDAILQNKIHQLEGQLGGLRFEKFSREFDRFRTEIFTEGVSGDFEDVPGKLTGEILHKKCRYVIIGEKFIGSSRVSFISDYHYGRGKTGLPEGEFYFLSFRIENAYLDSEIMIVEHDYSSSEAGTVMCRCSYMDKMLGDIGNIQDVDYILSIRYGTIPSLKSVNNDLILNPGQTLLTRFRRIAVCRELEDINKNISHIRELSLCFVFMCRLSRFLCDKYNICFQHGPLDE